MNSLASSFCRRSIILKNYSILSSFYLISGKEKEVRFSNQPVSPIASINFSKCFATTSSHKYSNMIVLNLVRHGETEMNKADIVQSRTPGDLTPRGIQMAENLGKYLKQEIFDKVYTSDLKRCHDTTLNILKHNDNPPQPILKPLLRERDYGDLEFKSNQTVRDLMKLHQKPNHIVPIPGGESHENVKKRCGEFVEELCQLADETLTVQNILAVSHGAWILSFFDHLAENTDRYDLQNYEHGTIDSHLLKNTARTKLCIGKIESGSNNNKTKRPIQFIHVHCVQHLKEM